MHGLLIVAGAFSTIFAGELLLGFAILDHIKINDLKCSTQQRTIMGLCGGASFLTGLCMMAGR